jgi:hypothetical protein
MDNIERLQNAFSIAYTNRGCRSGSVAVEDFEAIVGSRREKILVLALAHAMARDRADALHYRLGIPVVALTALVGSSAFANINDLGQGRILVGIGTGLLSISAAVLAALQTFLDYGGQAKAHGAAANRLSALNRRFDWIKRLNKEQRWQGIEELDQLLNTIAEDSPSVSQRWQDQARCIKDQTLQEIGWSRTFPADR